MSEHKTWLWAPRLVAAAILAVVATDKLAGGAHEVAIFTQLDMEPTGRVLIGILEGLGALLLVTAYAASGAVLAVGIMLGAIIAHITQLGVVVESDGGLHIALLATVLICSLVVAVVRRRELPFIGDTL